MVHDQGPDDGAERSRRLLVDGTPVAEVEVADTYGRRLRGLLGRRTWPEALWLEPCSSVHGLGMTRPVDVALVAHDGEVLATTVLRPFRATRPRRDVRSVVEAPPGSFDRWGLRAGSHVAVRPPG